MALAVVYSIDSLLTWNYSDLANPVVQRKKEEVIMKFGYLETHMVSPDTIPQVRYGQDPIRKFWHVAQPRSR
jgi:hypothetical protein